MVDSLATVDPTGDRLRKTILRGTLVLLVAGNLGVGFLIGTGGQHMVTVTTTLTTMGYSTQLASSRPFPIGLTLQASINSTLIRVGHGISVAATESNTVDTNITVSQFGLSNVSAWAGYYLAPCGSILPLGLAVFRGRYSNSNISLAGTPLQVIPYHLVWCPVPPRLFRVAFLADNDMSELYYDTPTGPQSGVMAMNTALRSTPCGDIVVAACSGALGVRGYWTGGGTGSINFTNAFHPFETGVYTVVVGSAWD